MPLVTKVSGPPNRCREDQAGEAFYSEVGQRGKTLVVGARERIASATGAGGGDKWLPASKGVS